MCVCVCVCVVSACKRSNESSGSIKCASFSRTLLHGVSEMYIINHKLKFVTDTTKLNMLQRTPFGIFCTAIQSKSLPSFFLPKYQKTLCNISGMLALFLCLDFQFAEGNFCCAHIHSVTERH